jgi:hypothetical protein
MTVACAWAGQMGGAIHLSLNFLLTFCFKIKSMKSKLPEVQTEVIWPFEEIGK